MEICKERFEAWLFSQPLDRVIEAGNGSKCFLCSFLKETTRLSPYFHAWDVWSPSGSRDLNALDHLPLPLWAMQLIDPGWMNLRFGCYSITVADMQSRYRELFPETPEPEAVPAMAIADAVKK